MTPDPNDDNRIAYIGQLIRHIASITTHPDRPFLIEGFTLGEIHSLAECIKAAVVEHGLSHQPLCVSTLNRAHAAAALIAALSGGPALLLPFAYSLETLEETRRKMGYHLALVDADCPLPPGVQPLVVKDLQGTGFSEKTSKWLDPDAPWLYLFTGGSTGSPQICSNTLRTLLSEASFLATTFNITGQDKILSTVPANHIYGLLYSVLLPFLSGAAVSVATPSFPKEIAHALVETGSTVFIGIPAHYRALRESPIDRHYLRTAFSSAGVLSPEDDWAFADATGVPITEIYGSTETGGIAFRKRAAGKASLETFSCVDVRIEKERLSVRSDFLSPELPKNGDGFYQTADRAMLDGHGGFQLLGRSDGIVKVGGKRVDLVKIQQVLKSEPGVRDAYVFTLPVDSGRENEILAVIEGEVAEDQIRGSALKGLEAYEQPRRIRIVKNTPVSMSGKYNRSAIEALFQKTAINPPETG